MGIDRGNDPRAFRDFLDARLSKSGQGLTLDDALDLWELENQTDEERDETVLAIREGLEDMRAGRTRPADEVFSELRREFRPPGT